MPTRLSQVNLVHHAVLAARQQAVRAAREQGHLVRASPVAGQPPRGHTSSLRQLRQAYLAVRCSRHNGFVGMIGHELCLEDVVGVARVKAAALHSGLPVPQDDLAGGSLQIKEWV